MQSNKIKDLPSIKAGRPVITIGPDAMIFEAVTRMIESNIGSILIVEGDNIRGIMSERDYLRFVALQGRTARDTPVTQLMTAKVIYVTPDTSLPEVMAIMTAERIRHVPVIENDKLIGIVSIGDVVKAISHDQEMHIRVLEQYINDSYPGPSTEPAGG